MSSFHTKKLDLIVAAISYPHKDLRWKDAYSMNMSCLQAKEFQAALDAKAYFIWAIEAYMTGAKFISVNEEMLKYNQALKNLELFGY